MTIFPTYAPEMRVASYCRYRVHRFRKYKGLTALVIVSLVLFTVNCGGGLGAQPNSNSNSGGSETSGSGSSNGTIFSDLQQSTWWNGYALLPSSYNICDTCTPSGPLATWGTTQGVKNPALSSGGSMKFDIGGTMPFADILWNVKFTKHLPDENMVPTLSNFTYDDARVQAVITPFPDCQEHPGLAISDFELPLNGTRIIATPPGSDICWRRALPAGPSPTRPGVEIISGWTQWNRVFTSSGRSIDSRL